MNISEIKDLMAQFDQSSLREFTYRKDGNELFFSKNEQSNVSRNVVESISASSQTVTSEVAPVLSQKDETVQSVQTSQEVEGDIVESPLVGVAYLSPGPDKPVFVSVGDMVKKGQTLLIVEAMKVMNEVPAPKDGVITEILVVNEEVVDFGKGLVRIK
ncbi:MULTISPECIES: acetyl-CoA carboxylase biotin carboxyl carrier protein [Streptococcus]|uniref:Biotin carboxyl carrier protein of acetyl-CoA carboxylase n=1 Tax=Streptococcus caledonicus TaxID=2614158 RepID=A0ABW0UAV2_9STRE|nr:acetyl-CoA carboxylase biotin carboxyl carrier protein [Streptococcus sp. S784/96/1]